MKNRKHLLTTCLLCALLAFTVIFGASAAVQTQAPEGDSLTWEYVDHPEQPAAQAEAYLLHITDQYGSPVPGVTVNFCTDKACTALVSDENGLITFTSPAENYHVKLLKAPAGYSFDADYELNTGAAAGEWRLIVRKD